MNDNVEDPDCSGCQQPPPYPSHEGSFTCRSGSIASGGTKAHCTCDTCW